MSGPLATPKTKAADLLLRAQVLDRGEFERVVALVAQNGERAEEVLVDNEIMSEGDLLKALSSIYRTNYLSTERLSKADIPRATVQMIPRRVAETLGVFPVLFDRAKSVLSVVTADPDNLDVLRDVKLVSGATEVKAFVARPAAIAAAIRKHHGGDPRAFDLLERAGLNYDFGQQVTRDGRVVAGKEQGRPPAYSAPSFDFDEPAPRAVSTGMSTTPGIQPPNLPAQRVAIPPSSPQIGAPRVARQTNPEPIESLEAPPLPPRALRARDPGATARGQSVEPQRGQSRGTASLSLSVPPPPPSTSPLPRAARAPVFSEPPDDESMPPTAVTELPRRATQRGTEPPSSTQARIDVLQHDTTVELLTVMVSLLETSRQELRGHSSQVARLLRRVAERMSLDRAETQAVVIAGHIHDLGKMGQFHLTALNCAEYEGHRVAAVKAYDTPLRLLEAVRLTASIKNAVFHMYERVDGKGFPDKLVGKDIPLGARLLSIADTYADLTQNPRNPFRKVLGPAEAVNVLMKHKGTIFDASLLDLFKSLVLGEDMRAKLMGSRYRVLLVDADPEESTVLELRMVEQGFDVKTARSAEAARKLLGSAEATEVDLVVCEVELPDGDGLAFLSEARKEPWGRDMPWVVHTRKQGRTEANRAFELGAMDFVAKPVQADVMVAKLKAMLDQWSTNRGPKGVNGSLREMGLPDIVQVLFHGRKTGRLVVRSAGKNGEIHFLEGAIANAQLGDLTGKDAFYALLKFQDGDFALDPSFTPPRRVMDDSAEALLLEGMRRMDEGL
ncbi:MAG: domain/GAF domain/HD domain protein [Labilithrix sp.]|nr:domain/GAF domain/HD domain protein [Labilithrix sp.]